MTKYSGVSLGGNRLVGVVDWFSDFPGMISSIGVIHGIREGAVDGCTDGRSVGAIDGFTDGSGEGFLDGKDDGPALGDVEGIVDGSDDGSADGDVEGIKDDNEVGSAGPAISLDMDVCIHESRLYTGQ
mmetsp:Transcript_7773/g.8991  ORF Transcript_7773/g.8991 Transcript_7773/m.8991 type:complete len:128 (-) Transcript_7773:99-482(-)|eukprot:CAMPEP_0204648400 /NCGR_PEP_ID=MMETSP0718-20130828/7700_1 /ASSEMBLY_ACC=CAM_ASM_000674 /TAXON_ID=230516 /ORGANISM="Chaetoceros curvisetus" /LENGTH=127 /DNA_ID=CAMNT_0051671213 /DNA_START=70 /DNA_END=456 /DNA_ORIENTATION=-